MYEISRSYKNVVSRTVARVNCRKLNCLKHFSSWKNFLKPYKSGCEFVFMFNLWKPQNPYKNFLKLIKLEFERKKLSEAWKPYNSMLKQSFWLKTLLKLQNRWEHYNYLKSTKSFLVKILAWNSLQNLTTANQAANFLSQNPFF